MAKRFSPAIASVLLIGALAPAVAQTLPGNGHVIVETPKPGARTPTSTIHLTPEQRTAIYHAVMKSPTAAAPQNVPLTIGAKVPQTTELYVLPEEAIASAPEAKNLKYTVVQKQVVLVDPATMEVVAVVSQ